MILVAIQARVTDWKALQLAWRDCCVSHRTPLVRHMRLYRNGHNASQALIVIEYADESAFDGSKAWQTPLRACIDAHSIQEHLWETIECSDE